MNQTKTIKTLAILYIALLPINLFLSSTLTPQLPPLLLEYLDEQSSLDITFWDLAFLAVALPAFIAQAIALIGILMEKAWSRSTLLVSSALMLLIMPITGPYVEHAIPTTMDYFGSVSLGALLALLYFGDTPFNKINEQE